MNANRTLIDRHRLSLTALGMSDRLGAEAAREWLVSQTVVGTSNLSRRARREQRRRDNRSR